MRVEQHFHADEHQHDGQADFQIAEIVDRPGQHEIQRAQAENGKDVRGENDERLGRDGENGGNGIQRKNQVGGFHHQQHQRQRRERLAAIQPGEKFLAVKFGADGKEFSREPDDGIFSGCTPSSPDKKHFDAGENQERAEEIERPLEALDERRARRRSSRRA